MEQYFISGFLKAAQSKGYSVDEAIDLYKEAARGDFARKFITDTVRSKPTMNTLSKYRGAVPKPYTLIINDHINSNKSLADDVRTMHESFKKPNVTVPSRYDKSYFGTLGKEHLTSTIRAARNISK